MRCPLAAGQARPENTISTKEVSVALKRRYVEGPLKQYLQSYERSLKKFFLEQNVPLHLTRLVFRLSKWNVNGVCPSNTALTNVDFYKEIKATGEGYFHFTVKPPGTAVGVRAAVSGFRFNVLRGRKIKWEKDKRPKMPDLYSAGIKRIRKS